MVVTPTKKKPNFEKKEVDIAGQIGISYVLVGGNTLKMEYLELDRSVYDSETNL
jgi:hypothetical protein